jgi:hypothetical protein
MVINKNARLTQKIRMAQRVTFAALMERVPPSSPVRHIAIGLYAGEMTPLEAKVPPQKCHATATQQFHDIGKSIDLDACKPPVLRGFKEVHRLGIEPRT